MEPVSVLEMECCDVVTEVKQKDLLEIDPSWILIVMQVVSALVEMCGTNVNVLKAQAGRKKFFFFGPRVHADKVTSMVMAAALSANVPVDVDEAVKVANSVLDRTVVASRDVVAQCVKDSVNLRNNKLHVQALSRLKANNI